MLCVVTLTSLTSGELEESSAKKRSRYCQAVAGVSKNTVSFRFVCSSSCHGDQSPSGVCVRNDKARPLFLGYCGFVIDVDGIERRRDLLLLGMKRPEQFVTSLEGGRSGVGSHP